MPGPDPPAAPTRRRCRLPRPSAPQAPRPPPAPAAPGSFPNLPPQCSPQPKMAPRVGPIGGGRGAAARGWGAAHLLGPRGRPRGWRGGAGGRGHPGGRGREPPAGARGLGRRRLPVWEQEFWGCGVSPGLRPCARTPVRPLCGWGAPVRGRVPPYALLQPGPGACPRRAPSGGLQQGASIPSTPLSPPKLFPASRSPQPVREALC